MLYWYVVIIIMSSIAWCFNNWIVDGDCEEGEIRLVGGNVTAGRVELCLHGVWSMVCDNHWDIRDARVTCRKLGLPFECE